MAVYFPDTLAGLSRRLRGLQAVGQPRCLLRLLRLVMFALIALPLALAAHDTWLIPSQFHTPPGVAVRLRLATSEAFPTSENSVAPARIARFTMRTASGASAVSGYHEEGKFLVADVTPREAGHAVLVLETKPRAFVLRPEVFDSYLREEQATAAMAIRAAKKQPAAPGRERYHKITKAILCVGEANDSLYSTNEGSWLEIIPEQDPCALKSGGSLKVRVLFDGQPRAGARVVAGYAGAPPGGPGHHYPVEVTADAEGRATVKFDRAGVWFIRTHHIVPAKNDKEADWESAFSSLTFEVLR